MRRARRPRSKLFNKMRKSIYFKLTRSLLRLVFPVILLMILVILGSSLWFVHRVAEPPRATYLITPERLAQFSKSGGNFTDETWTNVDKTTSRAWLVKSANSNNAVILLHRYGADRSWLLNLAVKLNQDANLTVLIPDLRGHGDKPNVAETSFGGCEADDLTAAIGVLRAAKNPKNENLVTGKIGVYAVEMGAGAALMNAANSNEITALALDSIPSAPSEILQQAIKQQLSSANQIFAPFTPNAAAAYFIRSGCYKNQAFCEVAKTVQTPKILLLAGSDNADLQKSTVELAGCFANRANVQQKTDLPISGYSVIKTATPAQQDAYNQIIVEFFRNM